MYGNDIPYKKWRDFDMSIPYTSAIQSALTSER